MIPLFYFVALVLLGCVAWLFPALFVKKRFKIERKNLSVAPVDDYFNWKVVQPTISLPFKKSYAMSMGIRRCAVEDWLLIENTYLARVNERKRIVKSHKNQTVYSHESSFDAIEELYSTVITFLASRYPKIFYQNDKDASMIQNSITGEEIPLSTKGTSADQQLLNLSKSVEEDFLLLIKDPLDNNIYKLRGGVWCFPNGFDPAEKFNRTMNEIHSPIPHLNEKLGLSIDRFFARMKDGSFVSRNNWAVQTHSNLFLISNTHSYSHDEIIKPLTLDDVDLSEIYVRSEYQVLTKLPKSDAIVFTIRAYMFTLSQIKEQGLGNAFCDAIDGLPESFGIYKRRPEWKQVIRDYLLNTTLV
ncbi:uncharacterized protein PRCAT00004292001 [Priceomyces carsonii]|uniref:uncharacterized protein n=1 Tax=Priceomyces carsonii TaxID=28549 RepID=UPI002ED7D5CB|nr:unnamed protein product [Priceomyces carsonii]